MICVTISAFFGIFVGSLSTFTGMSRVFASFLSTMVSVRHRGWRRNRFYSARRSTIHRLIFVIGWLLMTLTLPRTCVSSTMMKPAASLNNSRPSPAAHCGIQTQLV